MKNLEFFIWSAMAGAVFLVFMAAMASWLFSRTKGAWRSLVFVLVTGVAVVIMSGLPEEMLQVTNRTDWLPFKAAIGPLAGALALAYLGAWLGIMREDLWVGRTVIIGSMFVAAAGLALFVWAFASPDTSYTTLLEASAVATLVAVVLGLAVVVRGAILGDELAWRMCAACGFMTVLVLGLYAKALGYEAGTIGWALIVLAVLVYYLMVVSLSVQRDRSRHQLRKLARGSLDNDPVTGLPTGSVLVSKVDDALWRATRASRGSMVLAVWIGNLYALHDTVGREVDQEIRLILAARLRRTLGFRHVIGLYHPRCFTVAIANSPRQKSPSAIAERVYAALVMPMVVGAMEGHSQKYLPELGLALLSVAPAGAQATLAMDQAERLAQNASTGVSKILVADLDEAPIVVETAFESSNHEG